MTQRYKKFRPYRERKADIVAAQFDKPGDVKGVGPNVEDNRGRCPRCHALFRAHGKYRGQVICPGTVFYAPAGKTKLILSWMPGLDFDAKFEAVKK